jgi:hypothetical protein
MKVLATGAAGSRPLAAPEPGRVGRTINRRCPRYVRGSLGKSVRLGRVGPGGEDAGIHVGAQLLSLKRRRSTNSGCRPGAGSFTDDSA